MTSYPMHIYEEWMRAIFTFVIPMAFINYYPALYSAGQAGPVRTAGLGAFSVAAVAVLVFLGP